MRAVPLQIARWVPGGLPGARRRRVRLRRHPPGRPAVLPHRRRSRWSCRRSRPWPTPARSSGDDGREGVREVPHRRPDRRRRREAGGRRRLTRRLPVAKRARPVDLVARSRPAPSTSGRTSDGRRLRGRGAASPSGARRCAVTRGRAVGGGRRRWPLLSRRAEPGPAVRRGLGRADELVHDLGEPLRVVLVREVPGVRDHLDPGVRRQRRGVARRAAPGSPGRRGPRRPPSASPR